MISTSVSLGILDFSCLVYNHHLLHLKADFFVPFKLAIMATPVGTCNSYIFCADEKTCVFDLVYFLASQVCILKKYLPLNPQKDFTQWPDGHAAWQPAQVQARSMGSCGLGVPARSHYLVPIFSNWRCPRCCLVPSKIQVGGA